MEGAFLAVSRKSACCASVIWSRDWEPELLSLASSLRKMSVRSEPAVEVDGGFLLASKLDRVLVV